MPAVCQPWGAVGETEGYIQPRVDSRMKSPFIHLPSRTVFRPRCVPGTEDLAASLLVAQVGPLETGRQVWVPALPLAHSAMLGQA